MRGNLARRLLAVAGILAASFCFIASAQAGDRDHSGWSGGSLFDIFRRDRPRRSSLDDYRRRYGLDDDIYIYGRPSKKRLKRKRNTGPVRVVEEQPEPPLVYEPEKLEILKATDLSEAAPAGALAAAIYGELKGRKSAIRVSAGERRALVDFYRQNGFRPLWVSEQGLGERGRSVLRLFQGAAEDGMTPEDYLPVSLSRFDDDLSSISDDPSRLARLDLDLSAHALRYARHASGGRLVPDKLTKYYDITPQTVDLAAAMRAFQRTLHPADYLRSLQPQHPAYAIFKAKLAELRELGATPGNGLIRPGKRVVPGQDDPRIPLLRRHLAFLGYGDTATPTNEEMLDDALAEKLKSFQTDARIKPSGALDAPTILALNTRDSSAGVTRLVYNMERLRWLPKALGKRHVFVNQAAFTLKLVDDGREVWRTKVIVGKTNSQTVAFSDKMETVVFNPPWGVPPSIMKNEMMPRLRRDPGYLDRMGYRVLTPDGKKILHSRSIKWWKYKDGKVPYLVQQPPSDDNAMGEVKFLFPNAHSIYFHDTPVRSLFSQTVRALSHGCVRVENPRVFAEVLLGLGASDVAAMIDTGVSQEKPITQETEVHLTYFTMWPADDGRLLTYDDIYGRDERMARAFSTVAIASR